MSKNDFKNLLIAVLLSFAIIQGYDYFFAPKIEPLPEQETSTTTAVLPQTADQSMPRDQAIKLSQQRIPIHTQSLNGSINLQGAQFDDLTLVKYHETVDPSSPEISLLSPSQADNPYNAHFRWAAVDPTIPVPTPDTVWTAHGELTEDTPIRLTWDNGQGLTFIQEISVDQNYMFTVMQRVQNSGDKPVALAPIGQITRGGDIETSGFFILHEGPVAVFDGQLSDPSYDDVLDNETKTESNTIGWLGFTDKYWLTALVPDQTLKMNATFESVGTGDQTRYLSHYQRDSMVVQPGETVEVTDNFFAGAKVLELLDGYEETLGITHFDLAVDFGWFYFLTKPIFYIIEWLHGFLGNFGLAILALTVLFKILFFPLANKSYHAMARVKTLQPKVERLQKLYAEDRMKLNEKMMELYKKEKVNPASGCAPMLIQIPVFFALYKVLFVSIEMRHAPFYGWIHDLSAPDPTTVFNLFGLLPFTPPSFLMIGVWPLIMGATMLLQQRLSPPPGDPMQARMMMLLPIVFTVMLAQFPAGLVIYWACNNTLSIAQQWFIMRQDLAKNGKKK